jgi:predicted HTH transcriptional regulator
LGRGIEKINNECKMAGVPALEINYEFAGLMVTFQAEIEKKVEETRGKTRKLARKLYLSLKKTRRPVGKR